jgi:hypothetical protein
VVRREHPDYICPMHSRLRLAAIALAVVPLAACGSSGGSPANTGSTGNSASAPSSSGGGTAAKAYMHQVCSSIGNGLDGIKSEVQTYQGKVQQDRSKGLPALKQDTIEYFNNVTQQFQNMKDGVDQAGTPAVSNGSKVRQVLLQGFDRVLQTLHNVQADVQNLSTTNSQAFATKLQKDAQTVEKVGQSIDQTFQNQGQLGGQELDQAEQSDPTCQKLQSGGL